MQAAPTPSWMMIFIAILAIGLFLRLANAKRIGLLVLLVIGGVFLTYGLRRAELQAPPAIQHAAYHMTAPPVQVVVAVNEAPMPPQPEKPVRSKRAPKPKPAPKAVPGSSPLPAEMKDVEAPPEPPVAAVAESGAAATPAEPESPITLYHGWSASGRAIDSLPEWVTGKEKARDGARILTFSSDRFATIEEAEKQLWGKARDYVARVGDLLPRIPDASRWSPPAELLKSRGFVLERCVERTTIEVGKFVEPMYRVHWKASLSKNVRDSLVDAWTPMVQVNRLKSAVLGFLGATALLAFVNVILRLAPCPNAKKAPPAGAA